VEAPPQEIADALLSEFIEKNGTAPCIDFKLTAEQQQEYESRCRLYRLALVLLSLMNEEQENPRTLEVREHIETKVFGRRSRQSHALLRQVQAAMSDLHSLLMPVSNPKEFSWARSWFGSIGVDCPNPVDLALFARSWMGQFVAIVKSLRHFEIV